MGARRVRAAAAVAVLMLAAGLTGCGSDGDQPNATAVSRGAETVGTDERAATSPSESVDPELTKQVQAAAAEGKAEEVKRLLSAGAPADLGLAQSVAFAEADDPSLITAMVAAGLDPEVRDPSTPGHTLLMWVAEANHPKMVDAVLDAGADIDAVDDYDDPAVSVAAFNGSLAALKVLVQRGARLDQRGQLGNTALGWAKDQGHQDVVRYLTKQGAPE